MNLFSNCTLEKQKDLVVFHAFALAVLDQDELIEGLSIPKWWENAILRRFDAEKVAMYSCCTHSLAYGNFNRVTDHKGIWGLSSLPIGCMADSYLMPEGKVYWGIIQNEDLKHLHHYANVAIICSKERKLPMQEMKRLWEKHHIGFECVPDKSFFAELLRMIPDAVVLHYPEQGEAMLEVYGQGVENIFEESDALEEQEE